MVEIKIPSPGESISKVVIASWLVTTGTYVEKDQEIAELESEKATLPLLATEAGTVNLLFEAGTTVDVGSVACTIDTSSSKPSKKEVQNSKTVLQNNQKKEKENVVPVKKSEAGNIKITPLAQELMTENNLNVDDIIAGLRKITADDVRSVVNFKQNNQVFVNQVERVEERVEMTPLRKKLSERLVAVKNQTAMLTTFNELDMSSIIEIRNKYKDQFQKKYDIKLGFMSFFAKAVALTLKEFKNVNSRLEGDNLVYPNFVDLTIAVQTDKGLMVPVIRNADQLLIHELERAIFDMAEKARKHKISLEEMAGGTFTITNGGVFGSLLSTPILNPPQSAILGMHNIVERPVAVNGKVEIRPMMYIAMSYDHRVLDGKDSVLFVKKVKELLENPGFMFYGGNDPVRQLLGL